MSPNTNHHDVGLVYATNLYPSQQLFQMHKVYTLKQIHNDELSMDICAVMDGETYSGSLTAPAAATVAHLFQPGYVVKVRITKAWTHGRGDVWQEADEGDKADKGFDGQAGSKSVPGDSSPGKGPTE